MDDPESWRWIWLAAAVIFGVGEMATPGAFFLAPFALGAGAAAVLAFADVSLATQWFAFVGVSIVAFAGLRPLARRLDRDTGGADGIGSRRLIGREGTVLEAIEPSQLGMVRVESEQWRAEGPEHVSVPVGATIRVASVEGTRLIVTPVEEHTP
jgi:membrane protein implicated in regulation of membrane protease activity